MAKPQVTVTGASARRKMRRKISFLVPRGLALLTHSAARYFAAARALLPNLRPPKRACLQTSEICPSISSETSGSRAVVFYLSVRAWLFLVSSFAPLLFNELFPPFYSAILKPNFELCFS